MQGYCDQEELALRPRPTVPGPPAPPRLHCVLPLAAPRRQLALPPASSFFNWSAFSSVSCSFLYSFEQAFSPQRSLLLASARSFATAAAFSAAWRQASTSLPLLPRSFVSSASACFSLA
eukprot:2802600-Pleurochrysis_carterae.AAC.5